MIKDREIQLEGAHNVRDLGGVHTSEGRTLKSGKLFRSDALHKLTDNDLNTLNEYEIATIVDLRSSGEVSKTGPARLAERGSRHLHMQVMTGDPQVQNPDQMMRDAQAMYIHMVSESADRYTAVIAALCDPENQPALFHCAAGKDRTGITAALIYSILGVDREMIMADYALTEPNVEKIMANVIEAMPELKAMIESRPAGQKRADENTIKALLEHLDHEFGGPVDWLRHNGLSDTAMETLREAMLD